MIALEIGSILEGWVLARQSKAAMEAETRLTAGAATRGKCRNAPTRVVWKTPRDRQREREHRELEADQRAWGRGCHRWQVLAGRGSTSQRHRSAQPSCFSRAPVSCKAVALTQEGFSEDAPSSSTLLSQDDASCPGAASWALRRRLKLSAGPKCDPEGAVLSLDCGRAGCSSKAPRKAGI